MPARIAGVRSASIAQEMGIEVGDILASINGHDINDILDYQFYAQDDSLLVEVAKAGKEIWLLEIEKDYDEELGLEFADLLFTSLRRCQNRCVFCFVDQLPAGMRKSLYVKDDDYRHSFLYGNFVTLTNLKEEDWTKIMEMHLSPLYISVHCLQADTRTEMLQHPQAGKLRQQLLRLRDSGIEVHTQIVLCPGWNDGDILTDTIEGLAELYPAVASIGIVPVGLTRFRQGLPALETVSPQLARKVISVVDRLQASFRMAYGRGLVYLADEFYLLADGNIPDAAYYDDYSQIENGIGLVRQFWEEFWDLEPGLPQRVKAGTAAIVTGESGAAAIKPVVDRLNRIDGLCLEIVTVNNSFFGDKITVTGLLTGQDIKAALGRRYSGLRVILPAVVCREGQDVLLDGVDLAEIRASSGADLRLASGTAGSLVDAVLGAGVPSV